nr:tetratricopeptide repeat protein [Arthrospira platensis]
MIATAVLVGGTVCGGSLGAIATSVAGGIVANDMVPQHLKHIAVRLKGSQDKLGNHDLTQATGLAISLIIKSIAEAGTYPHSTKKLAALAKYTLKAWQEVAEALKKGKKVNFNPIQETELTELFRGGTREYVAQTVLSAEDWQILLKHWLCPGAKVELPENVVQEVATQLREKFAFALREVLKGDFEEGGRAFAGLTLSLLGEMQGILEELLNTSSQTQIQDLQAELAAVTRLRQELETDSQRFQELGNQIQSGFGEVLQELGITQGKIDEMRAELQQELQSVQETLREGLGNLSQQNQQLQETLETGFERVVAFFERDTSGIQAISFSLDTNPPKVTNWQGREEELSQVNRWLDDENTKLGVIVGLPGMGKSTLAAKLFRERTDFEDKLWLDLGQRPSYSLVARGILQELGKLSPQELEQIPETRLTNVLVHCLQRRRFLLVLDNLESVLQDEAYQDFLQRWLGACHQTEILVTTQVAPKLVQENPTELALGGLSAREGAQLLRELAVGGTEAELQEFVNQVNGHPLMLKLVAGLLHDELGDEATIGQLAGLGIADVGLLMSRLRGYHRQEVVQLVAVLDANFNGLSEKWRRLLLSLVVLRQAFDGTVASAMIGETVAHSELRGLAKRGFLLAEAQGYRFLPFIAEYLKFRLGDLWEAHLQAIEFYMSGMKPRAEWQTVEDVREYLEVFYHRCELGEYEAAFDVIRNGGDVADFLSLQGNNELLAELYQQLVENLPRRDDWRYGACLTSLGNTYNALGRYQEAIAFYQKSLEIARDIGDRKNEAASLNNLGNAYYSLGRYPEAIAFYQQSLEIARDIGDQKNEATSLGNLGNTYHSLGRYQEAIAFHQQSLEIKRDIGDRQGEATSLGNLGSAYYSLGRYPEAIAFYQQSLEIARDIGDQKNEATSLGNLGNTYHSLGRYQEAIAFHQQSLEIARDIGDRRGEANSLIGLGNAYYSLGRYPEAIAFCQQSLEIARDIGDRRGEANSLIGLGNAYKALGRYQEAIAFHQQSLEIKRDIGDRKNEAASLNNLGSAYYSLGRYQEAIAFHQQSLEIKRDIGDRQGEANSLIGLGNTYNALGRYQEAIAFCQQSLEIARDIGDRQGEAASLNNLGNAYNALGRYQEAIAFHQQSLEIKRDIGDRQGEAASLNNLGNAYYSLGRYPEAIAFYQQSLEIAQDIGDRRGEANSLIGLGNAYKALGRYQEGFAASQQAIEIYQELNLPLDAYPIPNWLKKLVKFSERGKLHLMLCFVGGLVAFPLVLIGGVLLILYRLVVRQIKG